MNPLRVWNRFWFAPTSARPLGALRILFGLIVLMHVALLALDAEDWLYDTGRLRGPEAIELAGPLRPSLLFLAQGPLGANLFLAATAVTALLVTVGCWTRPASVALYVLLLSIHHRVILAISGADTLVVIVAFLLMFSPCGASFSLDHRRRVRKLGAEFEPLILPWTVRLIQIQISLVYLTTAIIKVHGASWLNGSAIHLVLGNTEFRRFTFGLENAPMLTNAMTYLAVLTELALPFLLWVRAARPWIMLAGLMLHLGITLTINIPVFGELITACYLAFLTPTEFETLVGWLRLDRLKKPRAIPQATATIAGPHHSTPKKRDQIAVLSR